MKKVKQMKINKECPIEEAMADDTQPTLLVIDPPSQAHYQSGDSL